MRIELTLMGDYVDVDFDTPVEQISLDGLYAERAAFRKLIKHTNPYSIMYPVYTDRYNEYCAEIHLREKDIYY